MTNPTENEDRQAVIDGLRQLADFLAEHPHVPVNLAHTVYYSVNNYVPDADAHAEVDRVAKELGVEAGSPNPDYYEAVRNFGPVKYNATAISRRRMAAYEAELSYSGAVQAEAVA